MKKEIMVCNQHETPLIWTFAFPYAEYFCMAGNHAEGMLGAGHRVEATPELLKLQTLYKRRWGQLRRYVASGHYTRGDCETCKTTDEYHPQHWTETEKRRHNSALKRLEEYALKEQL